MHHIPVNGVNQFAVKFGIHLILYMNETCDFLRFTRMNWIKTTLYHNVSNHLLCETELWLIDID